MRQSPSREWISRKDAKAQRRANSSQDATRSENPGEHEIKIIYQGHLVRSFKFSVDAEGKILDNSIAASNKLGNNRVIVPVQVLGTSDGTWDKNAWKTDAFYGNPLTGFTVVP